MSPFLGFVSQGTDDVTQSQLEEREREGEGGREGERASTVCLCIFDSIKNSSFTSVFPLQLLK